MFPFTSVTTHVTVVKPSGKTAGASLVTEATPQLSDVVAVPIEIPEAEQIPASALTVISEGQVIVGSSASVTVTVCVQVAVFPPASVTVHVTVVTPVGKTAGASLVKETMVQLSEVTGVPSATPEA